MVDADPVNKKKRLRTYFFYFFLFLFFFHFCYWSNQNFQVPERELMVRIQLVIAKFQVKTIHALVVIILK